MKYLKENVRCVEVEMSASNNNPFIQDALERGTMEKDAVCAFIGIFKGHELKIDSVTGYSDDFWVITADRESLQRSVCGPSATVSYVDDPRVAELGSLYMVVMPKAGTAPPRKGDLVVVEDIKVDVASRVRVFVRPV